MTATALGLASALCTSLPARAETPHGRPAVMQVQPGEHRIQIAILLDTSSSMDGLIEQAKSQLWKIVNQAASAAKEGHRARVEIALYEYGKSSLDPKASWIRRILPFTGDLDRVSEELFALRTNGGEEYCGMVIHRATGDLEWSREPGDLKLVYIAGNEPFTQGPFSYKEAISEAKARGIVVNTIHCGGDEPTWKEAARYAGGDFLRIDQNKVIAYVAAPQDEELNRLSAELNHTYVAYGSRGGEAKQRQEAQDKNASGAMGGAGVARAAAKASAAYDSSTWDLVDGKKRGKVDVEKLAEEELPAELRKLPAAERQGYLDGKAAERERIQKRIGELTRAREAFVLEAQKKGGKTGNTLDEVMTESVRSQAVKAGFEMK